MMMLLRTHARAVLLAGLTLAFLFLSALSSAARATDGAYDELWDALRGGGHVALIRHAIAPGFGDPRDFRIGDCATQRNLSDDGRDQARRIGKRFRAHGISRAAVFTSQWCRCRETASLLGLGTPADLPALNSFFADRSTADAQTTATKDWLAARKQKAVRNGRNVPVLVTHQVNITALTGIVPRSGEIVVARVGPDGAVTPVGRIPTD